MSKLDKNLKILNIRYDDLSPFTPVYLGGSKVTFHKGLVINPSTLEKTEVEIAGTTLVNAWTESEPPKLTLKEGGEVCVLVITHSDKTETNTTDQCTIESCEIMTATQKDADAGEEGYEDTHTTIDIADIQIDTEKDIVSNPNDMHIVKCNVYALIFGTKTS